MRRHTADKTANQALLQFLLEERSVIRTVVSPQEYTVLYDLVDKSCIEDVIKQFVIMLCSKAEGTLLTIDLSRHILPLLIVHTRTPHRTFQTRLPNDSPEHLLSQIRKHPCHVGVVTFLRRNLWRWTCVLDQGDLRLLTQKTLRGAHMKVHETWDVARVFLCMILTGRPVPFLFVRVWKDIRQCLATYENPHQM